MTSAGIGGVDRYMTEPLILSVISTMDVRFSSANFAFSFETISTMLWWKRESPGIDSYVIATTSLSDSAGELSTSQVRTIVLVMSLLQLKPNVRMGATEDVFRGGLCKSSDGRAGLRCSRVRFTARF